MSGSSPLRVLSVSFILPFVLCLAVLARSSTRSGATRELPDPRLGETAPGEGAIRLVVRADDMGSSHAANVACLRAVKQGIARSVEVMVPGPWFPEAARLLRENPEVDAGVHLTLTSEWEDCRWAPLTCGPSLRDRDGYFHPRTRQSGDSPPLTGFVEAKPVDSEVEAELRAQIERARAALPRVTHLSCHMGTPVATPALAAITRKLSEEYGLPLELPEARHVPGFPAGSTPEGKVASLLEALEKLTPGLWLLVDHPGMDTPELRAQGHAGYRDVALDREGVTRAFTSPEVKAAIEKRGIRLVSYGEVHAKAP